MSIKNIITVVLVSILIVPFISCQKDELIEESENDSLTVNENVNYFPMEIGNKWTYSRDKQVYDYRQYDYDYFFSRYTLQVVINKLLKILKIEKFCSFYKLIN